jgi:uncharacterized membrane protein YfcA
MDLTSIHLLSLALLGFFAGGLGALLGIGGGLIIIPVLTLFFGVPIHQAIGTSLCCVIATSSGAAASYVEHHITDVRLGMTLELATTMGAVSGSLVAALISREGLSVLFAVLLTYAGGAMIHKARHPAEHASETAGSYKVRRLPMGLVASGGAGMVSGLLGVGGGPIKVPVMFLLLGIPFKVATATSNFMIGVTAAASAFIYFSRGDIPLLVAAPTAVGVFVGAAAGTHVMRKAQSRWLIVLFSIVMFYFAGMMVWHAYQGVVHHW